MSEVIKDYEKAERLNEAFRHLFAHFGIETQIQLAERMQVQRTALSAAFNGNKAYLTKNFFIKLCAAFPGVFNIQYFLKGEGTLLTTEEDAKSSEIEKATNPTVVEQAANIIDLYAGLIKEIESLRADLNAELAAARQERQEAHHLVTMLHDCLFHAHTITGPHLEEIPMAAESNENKPNVSPNNSPK